jgi:hypothetical protein
MLTVNDWGSTYLHHQEKIKQVQQLTYHQSYNRRNVVSCMLI